MTCILVAQSVNPLGSNSTQENSPRNSPDFASSPARFGWPAHSKHTAAACIDFFTYSDDHGSRQSGLCSESGAVASEQARTCVNLPIISSGFKTAAGIRGLCARLWLTYVIAKGRSEFWDRDQLTSIIDNNEFAPKNVWMGSCQMRWVWRSL